MIVLGIDIYYFYGLIFRYDFVVDFPSMTIDLVEVGIFLEVQ